VEPIYAPHGIEFPHLVQQEINRFFDPETPTPAPIRMGTADEPLLIKPRISL
jgi:hypothetical protein